MTSEERDKHESFYNSPLYLLFHSDYEVIKQKVAKRKLDGKMLSLEKVPVCHCVLVTGLNRKNTTKDAVFYYFENPRNGGGDVSNVELNIKEGWALVSFEDSQGILLTI